MKKMKTNTHNDETKDNRLRLLLHDVNKYVFFHAGPGAQQSRAISQLMNGPMSQKDLQEKLGVQPASISELISKLETRGLVERSRSDTDRRVVILSLTEKALKMEKKNLDVRTSDELFLCLNEEEKDQLIRLLEKLDKSFSDASRD